MSVSRLVRNSPDLARLVDHGYSIRVINGFLVVDDIPFVNDAAQVSSGSFLCPLDINGDITTTPSTHVMCFAGGVPRDRHGEPIDGLVNEGVDRWAASDQITAACGFSQKPEAGYVDFFDKVDTYAAMIVGHAKAIDPDATALTHRPMPADDGDDVFKFVDTFSSRAGLTEMNTRLALDKIVIIGLGGTGAYLLDLLSKTPARTIHLYDSDYFHTHNAFRSPGAVSIEQLQAGLTKVEHHRRTHSQMRRGIVAHPVNVTASNVSEICDADFVFLAMDSGPDKRVIIDALTAADVAFVDTGIGVSMDPDGINGQIRVTTSSPGRRDHLERDHLISYHAGADAEYDTNLQVSELNACAANIAVLRYKKHLGFYADAEKEHHAVYAIDANEVHNRYGTSSDNDGDEDAA